MTIPVRIQDDLYGAINGEWQTTTIIPADKVAYGADSKLSDHIRELLLHDLNTAIKQPQQADPNLVMASRLFSLAQDFKTRNLLGIKPAQARFNFLAHLTTWSDFTAALPTLIKECYPLPITFYVAADRNDGRKNALYLGTHGTILPDAALYEHLTAEHHHWLAEWQTMAQKLLQEFGLTAEQAQTLTQLALKFDQRQAPYIPTNVELADDRQYNHPYSWSDMAKFTANMDFATALSKVLPSQPQQVILPPEKFFQHLSSLINETNYQEWYAFALIQEVLTASVYLSDDLRILAGHYFRTLSHQEEPISRIKQAYAITTDYFDDPLGVFYGQHYFGEDAKADVTAMVQQIIATYRDQLQHNTWLSDTTRQKALRKLTTMTIKMGYPDAPFRLYDQLSVDLTASLFANILQLDQTIQQFWFQQIDQPVDRQEWAMPGYLVNACYDPSNNDITFPAGILQPPYYDYTWTPAQKLGGTGVTIGHEISHAFDNNGALFDEYGTMRNWWTDDDRQAFDQLINAMIQQFDGQLYEGTPVNGTLSVSENLADNAGMDVALTLLQATDHANPLEFFETYARSWRTKLRPEYAKILLMEDVHAPATCRVNIPIQNFNAWYDTYNVQPTDKLYLAPDQRLQIWNR